MGKPTGFLEYERMDGKVRPPKERLKDFQEFHRSLSEEERRKQGGRCMDCGIPFCQWGKDIAGMTSGCPLNNLVPEINDCVYRGSMEEAYERLHRTHNFAEFTSRVCPALCEAACTCGLNGEAVTAKENERAVIDYAWEQGLVTPKIPAVRTGKKVAVIGSGPAGLSAADLLNQRGHTVTVYERSDRPGGLLCYGIPNMKLDKRVVERRIRLMEQEGISFVTGADASEKELAERIREESDAVILAGGASKPRDIDVPGRELSGICFAVDFLSGVTKALLDSDFKVLPDGEVRGKKVLVIGGGDTGNDCVGTALRLGAESVCQVEMMPPNPPVRSKDNPWPLWPRVLKTDYGQEEAAFLSGRDPRIYETTVTEFQGDGEGRVCRVKLQKLKASKDPRTKRTVMVPKQGEETWMEADLVLIAAGFTGAEKKTLEAFGVGQNQRGNAETAPDSHRTGAPGVFAAGDMRRGQSLVVWALREGRDAAREVDQFLMGYTNLS